MVLTLVLTLLNSVRYFLHGVHKYNSLPEASHSSLTT